MLFENKIIHKISIVISLGFITYLLYIIIPTFFFVKDNHIGLNDSRYIHKVSLKPYIYDLANNLTQECISKLCEVQKILDYVTNIEYKINNWITMSPKKTIEVGHGDCDDKSNLLISLLNAKGFKSYFVLVPKHIFVVTKLKDNNLENTKGLYINNEKYYILESTAKNSKVGFQLRYHLNDIQAVIDPFRNEKVVVSLLEYKK